MTPDPEILVKNIRILFPLLAALAALPAVLDAEVSAGPADGLDRSAISVAIMPESIPLGGLALVTIISTDDEKRLTALVFMGNDIPFSPVEHNNRVYVALIGAGLDSTIGAHTMTIRWTGPHGDDEMNRQITVAPKSYPEEHLSVSKAMATFPPDILSRVMDDQRSVGEAISGRSDRMWEKPFIWPVNPVITSPFGIRRIYNGTPRSPHSGVDLRAPEGTTIKAANHGRVALVRDCYLSGKTVVLDHGGGLYTLYTHLSSYKVKKGQYIKRGNIIGLSGATGRATGPHLHWGVSFLGTRLDPVQLMGLLGDPARREKSLQPLRSEAHFHDNVQRERP